MAWLGDLLIRLKAETADFQQDMGKAATVAQRSLNQIQRAAAQLGVALSAGGFVLAVRSSIDAADHLHDLSLRTKIAVEDLAGLNVAAKQSGSDLDSMAASINKLAQNMGKTPEKFRQLGISAKDPLEAFKQFADLFNAIEDPQLRAATAAQALGKSWQGAAPALSEGSKKLGEMISTGRELSGITKDVTEQSDAFNDKLTLLVGTGGMMTKIITPILPLLNSLADDLLTAQRASKALNTEMSPLLEFLKVLLVVGSDVGCIFTTRGKDISRAAENVQLIATGQWAKSRELGRLFSEDAKRARAELDAWQKKIMEMGTKRLPSQQGESGDPVAAARNAAAAAARARAFLEKTNAQLALEKRMAAAIQEMENKRKSLFGTTEAALMQERLYGNEIDIGDGKLRHFKGTYEDFDKVVKDWLLNNAKEIDARNQNIARIEAEYGSLQMLSDAMQKDADIRDQTVRGFTQQNEEMLFGISLLGKSAREVEKLTAMRQIDLATQERIRSRAALTDDFDPNIGNIILEETRRGEAFKKIYAGTIAARQSAERTWQIGAAQGMHEYLDMVTNVAEQVKGVYLNTFSAMEDALVNFTKTGKLDFKSLADSIIGDIARIQIRRNIIVPLVGTDDKPGILTSGVNSILSIFGLGKRAAGGPVTGGTPYIVGERGPELFMPRTSGAIVPNYALKMVKPFAGVEKLFRKNLAQGASPFVGSFATGTPFVPETGMAMDHKGEAIIPAGNNPFAGGFSMPNVASRVTNVSSSREVNITNNISITGGGVTMGQVQQAVGQGMRATMRAIGESARR